MSGDFRVRRFGFFLGCASLVVLHSKDLVNWELASYCMDRLDLGPAFRLEGGNIYGRGIWAPCIRYHDGTFYVLSNVNGVGCQVFRSKSANGSWTRNQLPSMHDISVLFDDDGKIYAIFGARRPTIVELNKDLTDIVADSHRQMNAQGMGEGHHLYKVNGKYFDVSAIPGAHTDQVVARADSIDGPWEVQRMVRSESLGVPTQNSVRGGRRYNPTFVISHGDPNSGGGLTLHQGGIVDTPSGEWWSIIMQDHGSIGRMVALVPVTWENNFPPIGLPGNLRKAPNTWIKPNTGHSQDATPLFIRSDNFDSPELNPVWQWNHVPDDSKWSLTEKARVLRLHSSPAEPSGTAAQNARFQVVDLGKGRVALKAANGRLISAAEDAVSLKDLAGNPPGDAESFQWINLMRGDTMLMSLVNHRYLATKPNDPAAVTVSAVGPRPDRKGGACFKWEEVD